MSEKGSMPLGCVLLLLAVPLSAQVPSATPDAAGKDEVRSQVLEAILSTRERVVRDSARVLACGIAAFLGTRESALPGFSTRVEDRIVHIEAGSCQEASEEFWRRSGDAPRVLWILRTFEHVGADEFWVWARVARGTPATKQYHLERYRLTRSLPEGPWHVEEITISPQMHYAESFFTELRNR